MDATLIAVLAVLAFAAVVGGLGLAFGIVLAPRIGRAADRLDRDEEEPGDQPD